MFQRLKQWWYDRGFVVVSEDNHSNPPRLITKWCRTRKQASELASEYNDFSMFGDTWYSFWIPVKSFPTYLAKKELQWRGR